MRLIIKNLKEDSVTIIKNILSFGYYGDELIIDFERDHSYNSIDDIDEQLRDVGLGVNFYYFRGLSARCYDKVDSNFNSKDLWRSVASGPTYITCRIPEEIRNNLMIYCY